MTKEKERQEILRRLAEIERVLKMLESATRVTSARKAYGTEYGKEE